MQFNDLLQKLGLSEKEAMVYLAALGLGEVTIQQISRKAGVSRPSTYLQVTALIQKGLMSSVPRNKKALFIAEPPERLFELLKTQEREVKTKEEDLKAALPEIKNLFLLAHEQPQVRFYEGWEGMKSLRGELFKSKEKLIRNILSLDAFSSVAPQYQKDLTPERVQKKIHSRVLYTSKDEAALTSNPELLREARFISSKKFPFNGDISVSGEIITLSGYKGRYIGVVVRSEEIAETLKALFDLAWEAAEKYGQS